MYKLRSLKKKGQISGPLSGVFIALVGAALAFLVLVIALSLVGQILGTQETIQLADPRTVLAENETITGNGTLSNVGTRGLDANIQNTTVLVLTGDDQLVEGVNYSLDTLGNFTVFQFGATLSNISYNYTVVDTTQASNVSNSGLSGVDNVADLVPVMGLLLGIIALLGLLAILAVMFVGRIGGNEAF